jgi:hypothetical protein
MIFRPKIVTVASETGFSPRVQPPEVLPRFSTRGSQPHYGGLLPTDPAVSVTITLDGDPTCTLFAPVFPGRGSGQAAMLEQTLPSSQPRRLAV